MRTLKSLFSLAGSASRPRSCSRTAASRRPPAGRRVAGPGEADRDVVVAARGGDKGAQSAGIRGAEANEAVPVALPGLRPSTLRCTSQVAEVCRKVEPQGDHVVQVAIGCDLEHDDPGLVGARPELGRVEVTSPAATPKLKSALATGADSRAIAALASRARTMRRMGTLLTRWVAVLRLGRTYNRSTRETSPALPGFGTLSARLASIPTARIRFRTSGPGGRGGGCR